MQFKDKITELRSIIIDSLNPIIGENCILADAPYYNNIGDVLIWQGIEDFLKGSGKNLLSVTSVDTFLFPEISEDVTILLTGGGNFGDLWRLFQDFRLEVIKRYPNNRIVMFPQSVWYEDSTLIEYDARLLSYHKNLFLCARDQWSYDFLCKYFYANNILLVPDMAFCICNKILDSYRGNDLGLNLFFKRKDKELSNTTPLSINEDYDISDWPSYEKRIPLVYFLGKLLGARRRLQCSKKIYDGLGKCVDFYANRYLKKSLVRIGCKFIAPYSSIVTTRLHALILSVLLYKKVEYIDNTTRKLSAFSNTWLKDMSIVKPYEG